VKISFEVFGHAEPTLLLLPTWTIIHARSWKMQVPFLAEHHRVVTYDGPGNGRSDRPQTPDAYSQEAQVAHALAVLDATGTERAVLISLSRAANWALELLAEHPERVHAGVFIGPATQITPGHSSRQEAMAAFDNVTGRSDGWWKYNRHYWLEHYEDFLWFFFSQVFTEPHSTKPIQDCVSWGLETTPEVLVAEAETPYPDREQLLRWCRKIRCPVLVVHGSEDAVIPLERGRALAEASGGALVTLEGSGHAPHVRDAAAFNLLVQRFIAPLLPTAPKASAWQRALERPRRALFISSPIGLGHIQRDLAIARELRQLVPDLEIHWWAQHPVTRVLEEAGEFVHPVSYRMASESRHWEEEASEHELHAFYAFRRMDEIFLYNFMLFHNLVRSERYDLWIGDESWEVDYYLHENPELKTAPYVFLTDVIGFLPVDPENDPREASITADYNAEMIAQRARYPYLRDLSLYVGEYEDLPDTTFGPGLPKIQEWAREWFEAVGYVLPFDPSAYRDTAALRQRLGYAPDSPLVFAAVGGTAVGRSLLQRTAEAFALLQGRIPAARMVMVTGPRIDPAELPEVAGLEKHPYVHNLFEHLACCGAAVVQGGLSTTMELVATKRPFVYFPLRKHWEQMHHVAYRLDRYRGGTRLDFTSTTSETLAEGLEHALNQPVEYRDVPAGAARRAATRIASLLSRSW
jgi:pimeloyl-ACP methyl ester carboxylesterase/UDP:flavonoid glycosyltransferase YjiC (YdhE family)